MVNKLTPSQYYKLIEECTSVEQVQNLYHQYTDIIGGAIKRKTEIDDEMDRLQKEKESLMNDYGWDMMIYGVENQFKQRIGEIILGVEK